MPTAARLVKVECAPQALLAAAKRLIVPPRVPALPAPAVLLPHQLHCRPAS